MHAFPFFYTPFAASILVPFFLIAALWTIVLKGFALWYAARGSQKWWFVALLIVNTLGILEIIYLIWFRPKDGPTAHEESTPLHTSSPQ